MRREDPGGGANGARVRWDPKGPFVAQPSSGEELFEDQKSIVATRYGPEAVGANVAIARPYPFDLPDADRPFTQDTEHHTYDTTVVTRYWQVLSQVNLILEEFADGYSGKTSPVHHF